jgi:hypothetical protein
MTLEWGLGQRSCVCACARVVQQHPRTAACDCFEKCPEGGLTHAPNQVRDKLHAGSRERGVWTALQLATSDPEAKAWLLEQGLVVASLEIIGIVGDMVRKVAWQALNHTTLWLATLLVGAWADFSDNTRVSRLHVAICSTFVLKRTAPRLVPI